ncbi:MAG: hypothetical protein IJO59_03155, partial [Clostridia bacterium]|nr:hypothetical protein [Clostridia bacterium]
ATTEATTTTTEEVVEEEEKEVFYEPVNYPYEGVNGNFIIDDEVGPVDTGIPYEEGATFEVGENGNWYINGVDTGVAAILVEYTPEDEETPSEDEETPDMGENSFFSIVIVILAVTMGAMMVLFSKKNKVNAQ